MRTTASVRDRQGLDILTLEECRRRLAAAEVGRLAFVSDRGLQVLPVNHLLDGNDVVFRTAPGGKLDAARRAEEVAFEVDGVDPERRTGWSVLVRGRARLVGPIRAAHLADRALRPWADATARDHWVVVQTHHVTGREIHRPRSAVPRVVRSRERDPR